MIAKLHAVLVLAARVASAEPAPDGGYSIGFAASVEDTVLSPSGGGGKATTHLGPSFALDIGDFHGPDLLVARVAFSFFTTDPGPTHDSVDEGDALVMYEHHSCALGLGGGLGAALVHDSLSSSASFGLAIHALASEAGIRARAATRMALAQPASTPAETTVTPDQTTMLRLVASVDGADSSSSSHARARQAPDAEPLDRSPRGHRLPNLCLVPR